MMVGYGEKRPAQRGVFSKPLRSADQPQVQLVLRVARVRHQLGMEALRVIHEISGMNLEELRQKQPRRVGEMGTGAALDLGEIRLADACAASLAAACLCLNRPDQLLLGVARPKPRRLPSTSRRYRDFVSKLRGHALLQCYARTNVLQIAILISQSVISVKMN